MASAADTKTGGTRMTLQFPNLSQSFDAGKQRIRFWGYDSAIEITFFVDVAALEKLDATVAGSEAGYLSVFDSLRTRIQATAARLYTSGRERSYAYVLSAQDF